MKTVIAVQPANWVRGDLLPAIFGISTDAAKAYRKDGTWTFEVHYRLDPKKRVVYNREAIERWMTS